MNAYENFLAIAVHLKELPEESINLLTDILKSVISLHLSKNNSLVVSGFQPIGNEKTTPFEIDFQKLIGIVEESGQQGIDLAELGKKLGCPKEFLLRFVSHFPREIEQIGEERFIHKKYVQTETDSSKFEGRRKITVEKFLSFIKEGPIPIDVLAAKLGVKPASLRVFLSRHKKELKNVKFEKSYFMIVNSRNKKTEAIKTKKVLKILSEAGGRITNRDLAFKLGKTNSQISDWWADLVQKKAKHLKKIDYDPQEHVFLLKG